MIKTCLISAGGHFPAKDSQEKIKKVLDQDLWYDEVKGEGLYNLKRMVSKRNPFIRLAQYWRIAEGFGWGAASFELGSGEVDEREGFLKNFFLKIIILVDIIIF